MVSGGKGEKGGSVGEWKFENAEENSSILLLSLRFREPFLSIFGSARRMPCVQYTEMGGKEEEERLRES